MQDLVTKVVSIIAAYSYSHWTYAQGSQKSMEPVHYQVEKILQRLIASDLNMCCWVHRAFEVSDCCSKSLATPPRDAKHALGLALHLFLVIHYSLWHQDPGLQYSMWSATTVSAWVAFSASEITQLTPSACFWFHGHAVCCTYPGGAPILLSARSCLPSFGSASAPALSD